MSQTYRWENRRRFGTQSTLPARLGGFTMVELMVTLGVLAVLTALAVPSFTGLINSNRLAGMSNEVVAMLQVARMESMRRGVRVIVCPSNNGTACTTGERWNGWIAFADDNRDGLPATAEIVRVERVTAPLQMWVSPAVSGTGSRVVFRHDGFAYDNTGNLLAANLATCLPARFPVENARDVNIVTGARITVARRNANGACAAPTNP